MQHRLFIYKSNKINNLAAVAESYFKYESVFLKEQFFIVHNRGTEQYLKNRFSQKLGIIARTAFLRPGDFFWHIAQLCLPSLGTHKNLYNPDLLIWKIFTLFTAADLGSRYPAINRAVNHYLHQYQTARWELARQLAVLFDHYIIYRPQWLQIWEAGQLIPGLPAAAQIWQRDLWAYLTDGPQNESPGTIRQQVNTVLKQENPAVITELPQQIYLFAITALAPLYLELLHLLSAHINIRLFLFSPSREYWLEDCSPNPLLASWGTQGRDFYRLLLQTDYPAAPEQEIYEPDADADMSGESLLSVIQNDILNLTVAAIPRRSAAELRSDTSLQIHAAHSPVRELQILKNQLIAYLDAHPHTQLEEIAILSPDITAYLPYIAGIFGAKAADGIALNFTVADIALAQQPFFAAAAAIINFMNQRFDVDSVLILLNDNLIRRQFNFSYDEVRKSAVIFKKINVSWGLDLEQRQQLGSENDQFTWDKALKKLDLLLTWQSGAAAEQFILLFKELYGAVTEPEVTTAAVRVTISKLIIWIKTISRLYRDWQRQELNLINRIELFKTVCHDLIHPDTDDDVRRRLLVNLNTLNANAAATQFQGIIDGLTFAELLATEINNLPRAGFLYSGITFAALKPRRVIPFKFIALLGMNDQDFPRQDLPPSFDLIHHHHQLGYRQPGDLSRREDDRYLFLETLLNAGEVFYLSYIGHSPDKNEPLNPSPLIDELIDLVAQMSGTAQKTLAAEWVIHHPLQNFSPQYFNRGLVQYRADYWQAYQRPARACPSFLSNFTGQINVPARLNLKELQKFWRNPGRAWLQEQLKWREVWTDKSYDYREPFTLYQDLQQRPGLAKTYNETGSFLIESWWQQCRGRQKFTPWEETWRFLDCYPSGSFGTVWRQKLARSFTDLLHYTIAPKQKEGETVTTRAAVTSLATLLALPEERETLSLTADNMTLYGTSEAIFGNTQIICVPNTAITDKAVIDAYLAHLAFNVNKGWRQTIIFSLEEISLFLPLSPSAAQTRLQQWLQLTGHGLVTPLAFFKKISLPAAQKVVAANNKQQEKARKEDNKAKTKPTVPLKNIEEILNTQLAKILNQEDAEQELAYPENQILFKPGELNAEHPNFIPIIRKLLIPLYDNYQKIRTQK